MEQKDPPYQEDYNMQYQYDDYYEQQEQGNGYEQEQQLIEDPILSQQFENNENPYGIQILDDDNQYYDNSYGIQTIEDPLPQQSNENPEILQLIDDNINQQFENFNPSENQILDDTIKETIEIKEDQQEFQQMVIQDLKEYEYLQDEKVNLIGKEEVKQDNFSNYIQLVDPNEELYSKEQIEKSDNLIEKVSKKYEKDDIFVIKVLKEGLKQEDVQLIVQDQVTIKEDRSLAKLLNGAYDQKQIIEMKFQDTKEQNFQKLKNSKKEEDKFILDFKSKIVSGSIKVHFVIKDPKGNAKTVTQNEIEKAAKQGGLTGFELKLNPIFKYCTLSPQQFDTRGNIDFTKKKAQVEQRGGLVYNQPDQWKRYGLKVMGQFKNARRIVDDTWLTDWSVKGWAVAYHGFSESRGNNRTKQQKMVNYAINNIVENGFLPGSNQFFKGKPDIKTGKPITEGIYFSNIVQDAEYYGSFITIPEDSDNKYKIVFTCRLNPKGIQFASQTYYVVQDNKDIRPFGILLKKYPK